MLHVAHRLIAEEQGLSGADDTEGRAAFRVCDKLRQSLSVLTGTRGFRALFVRALKLAEADARWLGKLEVGENGVLTLPAELERELTPSDSARGGAALVAHLLELLVTFIGATLTLRLVQQIWPKAALGELRSEGMP